MLAHDVPASVPEVEVPDHRDAPGVRGPHGEARACDAFELYRVRPELFVEPEVVALAEEVNVLLAEHSGKPVGVFDLGLSATLPRDLQTVGHASPRRVRRRALQGGCAPARPEHRRRRRRPPRCSRPGRKTRTTKPPLLCGVHPEEGERVWMVAGYHGGNRVFVLHDPSSPSGSPRRSRTPLMGMPTQSGRLSSS